MASAKERVVVGLSGGVDSAVAALLLKEQGFQVLGVTLELWRADSSPAAPQAPDAVEDARVVARLLQIPHETMDLQGLFREKVVGYFTREYLGGRTPNPCLLCNPAVKWEALLGYAQAHDAAWVATGHYARIRRLENGRYTLLTAAHGRKDQTYALYGLSQEQLSRTRMPLGELCKEEVRKKAQQAGIPVAEKPDSQDVCFLPQGEYAAFLQKETGGALVPGDFVTPQGRVLGRHQGIACSTVGQRKGLGLALGYPAFVTQIRKEENQVVVGTRQEALRRQVECCSLNLMDRERLEEPVRAFGKVRYNHRGAWCLARQTGEDRLTCVFEEPLMAPAPGQALVLYREGHILGGGIICDTK